VEMIERFTSELDTAERHQGRVRHRQD
jgi:hypothetical protein